MIMLIKVIIIWMITMVRCIFPLALLLILLNPHIHNMSTMLLINLYVRSYLCDWNNIC